ncbi:hypothetical protein [Elizabethkingia anophelis]|uniref:hypothetical protein n=1 Tax=Elizabethkingia anophelis TaxID=1117645 RepID=UPI001629897E|nr:hypothetical protein [Elizabethkingia anophelis]MCT3642293.1 hypothetical protein [Elizabethkingia anophelis]
MKTQELKNKVEALLIKRGNNANEVKRVIEEGFDFAITKYTKASQIANYLIICY